MFGVVIASCVTLVFCTLVTAQNDPHRGKINVPFEFYIGGVGFPAGQYILEAASPAYGKLRSIDGKNEQRLYFVQKSEKEQVEYFAPDGIPVKRPMVIFAKRYNKYYFSAVWSWFGLMQFTGFSSHPYDETKQVLITPVE